MKAYNLTAIDGLGREEFPVVDIFRSSGERLGCVTTALLNLTILMDLLGEVRPSERALELEDDLKIKDGIAQAEDYLRVLDGFIRQNDLENLVFSDVKPSLYFLLFLLINDFHILILNQSKAHDVGHMDVLFSRDRKIYFNSWELNQEELEALVFHDKVVLMAFRDQRRLGRVFLARESLESMTVSLSEDQKIFLQKSEILLIEKPINEILLEPDFIARPLREILEEKAQLLKNLKFLSEGVVVIF